MKQFFICILLFQLLSCKTDSNTSSNIKNESKTTADNSSVNNTEIRYVIARSGLNYRKTPKGKILGKFEFGQKLQIVEHTNIFDEIVDENKHISGEWVGVQIEKESDVKYVFDGFITKKKEFDHIGNNIENLIPYGYEIEYKTEGDLNGDNIDDIVTVIRKTENFNGNRIVMVFLKKENSYKIDKVSNTVFPNKFFSNESDMETYYQEDINISNKELKIQLYGTGPVGNNLSTFKYDDKKLILTHIETYNVGAGSHHSLNFDVINSKLIEEVTNTMEEDMPTSTQTFIIPKQEYLFEKCSPEDIISDVYRSTSNANQID
ncbi:hypothetical protein [uncultured Aquimarina sp.]|uniref:hypothetical protein n=1 Tax=uncultured Aquimarina sp. TaxID=575652 RepID=UPI00261329F5|nr:hypothetical protein [uncultured Aquimarina sp.]